MNGVKRANGFDGERPPDSCEHAVCHGNDIATPFKTTECQYRRTLLLDRQAAARTGTKDSASGFCQRQC